jgi:hypothetical protein
MANGEENQELTDVVLCYQSMGVALDASPAEIEQMLKALTEENKRKMGSPDPAIREEGRRSLDLVHEMYDKICGSITYRAMEQEHLRRASQVQAGKASAPRPVHRAVREKTLMMQCPRCNGTIAKGLKVCPVCKSRLYTVTEKILRSLFTRNKVIAYCLILVVGASLVFFYLQDREQTKDGMTNLDPLEQKGAPR